MPQYAPQIYGVNPLRASPLICSGCQFNVRAAEGRAQIADAQRRAAQSEHDRASIEHAQAIEASWDPISSGVFHLVGLGLLVVVPLVLLLAAGLLLRRHLSLPTRDGRVAVVGLDRELSREALIRYQLRELAGVATYEALPVGRPRSEGEELLERKPAGIESGGER